MQIYPGPSTTHLRVRKGGTQSAQAKAMTMNNAKRNIGEIVELSRDCELGQEGDRAVVTALIGHYMALTFPDRAPDCRVVHTGSDYKYLRAHEGTIEESVAELIAAAKEPPDPERAAALQELRMLVVTYLEGSDDAVRAFDLLDALSEQTPPPAPAASAQPVMSDDRARAMFGCTATAIDEVLASKSPRDVAMYAMGTLSNAQELIRRDVYEGTVEWSVADSDANTVRMLINVAKYAIDKAVPR